MNFFARIFAKPLIYSSLLCSFYTPSLLAQSFETDLLNSLQTLQFEDSAKAENQIASLLENYPTSQTAHLLMADLFAARAGMVNPEALHEETQELAALQQLDGLRDELRLRWNQETVLNLAQNGMRPASIIQLAPDRPSVVFIDAPKARLYVFNNTDGDLSLTRDSYTSIGQKGMHKRVEGDQRTPIGVYYVTSYLQEKDLPPRYGTGAFPINYPNELDKKYKRTGYGIWLHGSPPESFNRVPLASDGCVAMSNVQFDLLKPLIKPNNNTPVIISNEAQWVKPQDLDLTRQFFNQLLANWVSDWESLDPERFLRHYDASFYSPDHNYTTWSKRKTATITGKTQIKVDLSNISLFAYPGESDMVVAEFTQAYQSNNFDSESKKRQYWQLQTDETNQSSDWKIIYEGPQ